MEKADIEASNGIIHIMEETIDPIPTGNIAEVVSTDHRCALLYITLQYVNYIVCKNLSLSKLCSILNYSTVLYSTVLYSI